MIFFPEIYPSDRDKSYRATVRAQGEMFGFVNGTTYTNCEVNTDPRRAIRSVIFADYEASQFFPSAVRIAAFEAGKQSDPGVPLACGNSKGCADISIFFPVASGMAAFIGDGVNVVGDPHPLVQNMMEKVGVLRPDMLPSVIIRENIQNIQLFINNWISSNKDLERCGVFSYMNYIISHYYAEHDLLRHGRFHSSDPYDCTSHLDSIAQLPGLVGTFIILDKYNKRVYVESIGDTRGYVVRQDGSMQTLLSVQNEGFDIFTAQFIEEVLKMNPAITIQSITSSEAFVKWIFEMYEKKVNQPGGVGVMNGLNYGKQSPRSVYSFDLSSVRQLAVGTDGMWHGNDPKGAFAELLKVYDLEMLSRFIQHRVTLQYPTYWHSEVSRGRDGIVEKPSDDISGFFISFKQNDALRMDFERYLAMFSR